MSRALLGGTWRALGTLLEAILEKDPGNTAPGRSPGETSPYIGFQPLHDPGTRIGGPPLASLFDFAFLTDFHHHLDVTKS